VVKRVNASSVSASLFPKLEPAGDAEERDRDERAGRIAPAGGCSYDDRGAGEDEREEGDGEEEERVLARRGTRSVASPPIAGPARRGREPEDEIRRRRRSALGSPDR
jgi:hypothetical protein